MKKIVVVFALICLFALPVAGKETFKINPGQYMLLDGKIQMLTAQLERVQRGYLIQPQANIGLTPSFITSVSTNPAGKWEVVFFVNGEKYPYEIKYQLASGDVWTLYAIQNAAGKLKSTPIVLKVENIKNNEVEVSVVEKQ